MSHSLAPPAWPGPQRPVDFARLVSRPRHFPRGANLPFTADTVLEVLTGVLAVRVTHTDGEEVLLGLCAPGQLVLPHPEDGCYLCLTAHTAVTVGVQTWSEASLRPDFAARLRDRLRQMEAWASVQARPKLGQRVLGLLSLLAEPFGTAHPAGTLVDVRLTHAQLASAVNASRAHLTRIVGELAEAEQLVIIGTGRDQRFCLTPAGLTSAGQHLSCPERGQPYGCCPA